MKNLILGKPILVSTFLLLVVLILNSRLTTSQLELDDESEFSYIEGSENGPERWGYLKKEWATCKNGKKQSPIDLVYESVKVVPELGPLKKKYKPAYATLKNRGHDISVQWVSGAAGSININGIEYTLEQLHWHTPSEHFINGYRFPLEMHMVHRNVRLNKIAVIAVLYMFGGRPDPFLFDLTKAIMKIADNTNIDEVKVGMVDPSQINNIDCDDAKYYYRYLGSLTTPPCTEGVIWTIKYQLASVSKAQVELLRMAVHDNAKNNARPLQPLYDRDILFYSPIYIETLPTTTSSIDII